jgi:hypothetical protein
MFPDNLSIGHKAKNTFMILIKLALANIKIALTMKLQPGIELGL